MENKIVQRFYSDESVFIKLENATTRFDYYYWEEQCRGETSYLLIS